MAGLRRELRIRKPVNGKNFSCSNKKPDSNQRWTLSQKNRNAKMGSPSKCHLALKLVDLF